MKTTEVYVKVSVEDRLPEKEGAYTTYYGTYKYYMYEDESKNGFYDNMFRKIEVEWWLEKQEVAIVMTPEEHRREILKEIQLFDEWRGEFGWKIEYQEQRSFSTEELYDIYLKER